MGEAATIVDVALDVVDGNDVLEVYPQTGHEQVQVSPAVLFLHRLHLVDAVDFHQVVLLVLVLELQQFS